MGKKAERAGAGAAKTRAPAPVSPRAAKASRGPATQLASPPGSPRAGAAKEAWDVIIVGAGIAGCALAYKLGQDGRRVLLLERDLTEPDRIVGELLQPGGYLKLKELGLEHCVDGIDAQKVYGYCLMKGGKFAKVGYPGEAGEDIAGRSFHNGRFVMQLRKAACTQPSVCLRQGAVRHLNNTSKQAWSPGDVVGGVQYQTSGPAAALVDVEAPLTIACDGMYSVLRKDLSAGTVAAPSYFVGLILEGCQLPYANHGHVLLGDPSPVLFYPISSTEVRCLVDVPGASLPSVASGAMAKYLREVVEPQVPLVLRESFRLAVDRGHYRSMQNKTLAPHPLRQPGALLLGDSFNMRHPLTGGGMTVALSDVSVLCDMLGPLPNFADVALTRRRADAFYAARTKPASTINTLANALYKVFCRSADPAMEEMRQACFDYLASGGVRSAGPVALLGGLDSNPVNLVMHFFAVAVFGVTRLLPRGLSGVWTSIKVLRGACAIILPIMYAEGLGGMFLPGGPAPAAMKRKAAEPAGAAVGPASPRAAKRRAVKP